jgi:hypothetical protein
MVEKNCYVGKRYEKYSLEDKLFPKESVKRLVDYYSDSNEIMRQFSIKYHNKHPHNAMDYSDYVLKLSEESKVRDRFLRIYYPLTRDD